MERRRKKGFPSAPSLPTTPILPPLSLFSADVAVVNRVAGEAAAEPAAEDSGGGGGMMVHLCLIRTRAGALPEIKMKATP